MVIEEYTQTMEHFVSEGEGYIKEYVGDEIVAVFGYPLSEDRKEDRALRVAIIMLEEFEDLVAGWQFVAAQYPARTRSGFLAKISREQLDNPLGHGHGAVRFGLLLAWK